MTCITYPNGTIVCSRLDRLKPEDPVGAVTLGVLERYRKKLGISPETMEDLSQKNIGKAYIPEQYLEGEAWKLMEAMKSFDGGQRCLEM